MKFAKLHGLGNDFLLLDLRRNEDGAAPSAEEAARLCDRRRGIGADGVLTLLPGRVGDARLLIHNADGSVPEMCGNGARCAALWIATSGCARPGKGRVVLETDAGPRPCDVDVSDVTSGIVSVEMGRAQIGRPLPLVVGGRRLEALPVSLGNPHRVFFISEASPGALREMAADAGPGLCRAQDANIEFASRVAPLRYAAAVWERGAGLTQACGTGACAVAAAAISRDEAQPGQEITVELPGGALGIRVDPESGELRMRGPAQLVFRGETA